MSQNAVEEIYQQMILEHNKKPRNFGALANPSHHAEGLNPLCGDHYNVFLRVEGGVVREVSFEGSGCAISKASASMMTQAVKDKSVPDAEKLFEEFHLLLLGKLDPEKQVNALGKLKVFSGIWKYPSRVKCAGLSWHALKSALQGQATVSTEGGA